LLANSRSATGSALAAEQHWLRYARLNQVAELLWLALSVPKSVNQIKKRSDR